MRVLDIGAAAGTVVGAVTGLSIVQGILIGAAAGGLTGALTDEETIDLGDPLWADEDGSDQSSGAATSSTDANDDLVREVQSGLAQLGYDPGPVDGQYGARTRSAVTTY